MTFEGEVGRFLSGKNFFLQRPTWPIFFFFFSVKKRCKILFLEITCYRTFFYSNKELDSPTYCKTTKSYPEDSTDSVDFIKKKSPSGSYTKIYTAQPWAQR